MDLLTHENNNLKEELGYLRATLLDLLAKEKKNKDKDQDKE